MNVSDHPPSTFSRRGLSFLAKFTCLCTLILIFMGGLVKSHEAGLAVPDWPNTYGHNMFTFPVSEWVGGVFYEHTHRLAASFVGFLTLLLAGWLCWKEPRRWVKALGIVALVAVIAQGVLGGVTVLLHLPDAISIAHGVLAQSFFLLTIVLAYALSKERARRETKPEPAASVTLRRWTLGATVLVFVQLILGAVMRHTDSGLAIPDFPTMGGSWLPFLGPQQLEWINAWRASHAFETGANVPAVTMAQVWIHFAHRLGALVVTAALLGVAFYAWRGSQHGAVIARSAGYLVALLLVQVSLGIGVIVASKEPISTSLHVVFGAALLGMCMLMVLRVIPVRRKSALEHANEAASADSRDEGKRAAYA